MSVPTPPSKPRASLGVVIAAANRAWDDARPGTPLPPLFVLAVRAYYRDSMGAPRENDYGIFDDAFFIVSQNGCTSWNGNSDPSRIGWNSKAQKFMARLTPGVWNFRRLKHKMASPSGYMAFGQGPDVVTVERLDSAGKVKQVETGQFGINLHRASSQSTSSEGCLTVPLDQWVPFRNTLDAAIAAAEVTTFPMILIDGPVN